MESLGKSFRSIILGLACFAILLSWLLPSHFRPWATAYQELLAAIGLLLVCAALLVIRDCRLPLASILIACLAVIPVLQLSAGILNYAGDAWISVSYILALALAIFAGYNLQVTSQGQSSTAFAEHIAWTLLLGCVISAVLAVIQWLGFASFEWISPIQNPARPFANLAQPNNLATLLGMGLMSLLFLFEQRKIYRLPAVLLALFLLFGLALTQSRTPWLTAIFIFGFWFWQQRHLKLRVTTRQMLLWGLIYTALVVSVPLLTEYLGIGDGSLMDRVQQTARWTIYQQFIQAVLQGPWYGYGWSQVFVAQAAMSLEYSLYVPTFYTHNVLLDLLIWNGPVLGGLIILFTIIWFWRLLSRANNLTAAYAWLALSCFIFHSMLEYPHAYLLLLIPAGLLLGILQASVSHDWSSVRASGVVRLVVVIAVATMTGTIWRDYHLVELEHQRAVLEVHDEFVPKHQQDISRVYLLTNMREYVYFIRAPLRTDYSETQLAELQAITARYPHFYFLLKTAYILAVNDQVDKAHELMLMLEGLHQRHNLERSLSYMLEKTEEHPDLFKLLERFGIKPE